MHNLSNSMIKDKAEASSLDVSFSVTTHPNHLSIKTPKGENKIIYNDHTNALIESINKNQINPYLIDTFPKKEILVEVNHCNQTKVVKLHADPGIYLDEQELNLDPDYQVFLDAKLKDYNERKYDSINFKEVKNEDKSLFWKICEINEKFKKKEEEIFEGRHLDCIKSLKGMKNVKFYSIHIFKKDCFWVIVRIGCKQDTHVNGLFFKQCLFCFNSVNILFEQVKKNFMAQGIQITEEKMKGGLIDENINNRVHDSQFNGKNEFEKNFRLEESKLKSLSVDNFEKKEDDFFYGEKRLKKTVINNNEEIFTKKMTGDDLEKIKNSDDKNNSIGDFNLCKRNNKEKIFEKIETSNIKNNQIHNLKNLDKMHDQNINEEGINNLHKYNTINKNLIERKEPNKFYDQSNDKSFRENKSKQNQNLTNNQTIRQNHEPLTFIKKNSPMMREEEFFNQNIRNINQQNMHKDYNSINNNNLQKNYDNKNTPRNLCTPSYNNYYKNQRSDAFLYNQKIPNINHTSHLQNNLQFQHNNRDIINNEKHHNFLNMTPRFINQNSMQNVNNHPINFNTNINYAKQENFNKNMQDKNRLENYNNNIENQRRYNQMQNHYKNENINNQVNDKSSYNINQKDNIYNKSLGMNQNYINEKFNQNQKNVIKTPNSVSAFHNQNKNLNAIKTPNTFPAFHNQNKISNVNPVFDHQNNEFYRKTPNLNQFSSQNNENLSKMEYKNQYVFENKPDPRYFANQNNFENMRNGLNLQNFNSNVNQNANKNLENNKNTISSQTKNYNTLKNIDRKNAGSVNDFVNRPRISQFVNRPVNEDHLESKTNFNKPVENQNYINKKNHFEESNIRNQKDNFYEENKFKQLPINASHIDVVRGNIKTEKCKINSEFTKNNVYVKKPKEEVFEEKSFNPIVFMQDTKFDKEQVKKYKSDKKEEKKIQNMPEFF